MTHFMKLYPGHNSVITRSDNEEDSQNIIWPSEPVMAFAKKDSNNPFYLLHDSIHEYLINTSVVPFVKCFKTL